MIITISGTAGSGKSTVGKLLAKKLKYKHYSMGDLQRQIAEQRGITLLELGKLEETDPSIDKELDQKQIQLGKTENKFIIDGRL
ncbi:AAA family ATPase, partial [Candidatus Woesearchaeota archaeon]|nr:AAA family ATPase [Candidatus Woesearchaeota archaeon]